MFPSLGCPSILNKNESEDLIVAISEERQISEDNIVIQHAELESIDSSDIYSLDNQIMNYSTWIYTGIDTVEDEIIVHYDISTIPSGFYDILITTLKDEYRWPHAVKIINEEPTEYSFVQLTDTHIGKNYNFVNEKKQLENRIKYINEEIQPDFVVITGDLIDWCKPAIARNIWCDLQELILTCDAPVFTTPGNHDCYENGIYLLHTPYKNLTSYHIYLNP